MDYLIYLTSTQIMPNLQGQERGKKIVCVKFSRLTQKLLRKLLIFGNREQSHSSGTVPCKKNFL